MLALARIREARLSHVLAATLAVALTTVAYKVGKSVRRKIRIGRQLKGIPGPKGHFILGLGPELHKNLHRLYDFQTDLLKKYGGRLYEPWGLFTNNIVYISSPEDLEHVLNHNVDNYVKPTYLTSSLGKIFTPTLLGLQHAHTEDGGARFRLQRKLVARVFTTNHFREFTRDVFHKHALRTIEAINAQGGKVNMHAVANMFTLQTIFDIGLGLSLEDYDEELGLQFMVIMDEIFEGIAARLIYKPYWKYFWWCMPGEYRLERESTTLLTLVDGILTERMDQSDEELSKRKDILSMVIGKARELEAKGNNSLDKKTLLGCVTGLLFGGRDTISATILFSFYYFAQSPELQEKVLAELSTINVDKLTYEDISKLEYLDAFVWEVLRLNPTTPISNRQAAEDDFLPDGTFIPAGTEIFWSSYAIGRNATNLWGEDTYTFRPERWLEMEKRPTMYEYPVFQGGLRFCPGKNMALLETKVFIAIMLPKFFVKIQEGEQLHDRPYGISLALSMKDGLPLQLTPRV